MLLNPSLPLLVSDYAMALSTIETLNKASESPQMFGITSTQMGEVSDIEEYCQEKLINVIYADTAILTISGMLIPKFSWMERYFDVVSYEAIREAVKLLMKDDEIEKVLVVVESPGGYAMGCGSTYDALQNLAKAKPASICFTDSGMASAGYWLGCAMPTMVASKYALVGSIGAYTSYTTQFRRYQEAGLDSYIARSGDKKGVPSGIEKLSENDRKVIDARNKVQADTFLDSVRDARSSKLSTDEWHSGETFIAKKAKKLGIIDQIASYSDVLNVMKTFDITQA